MSNTINKHINIFTVSYCELEERLDPSFYKPEYFNILTKKVNWEKVRNISISIHHPPEYERVYSETGIQLIRSQNIRPTGLSLSESPVFFSADFLTKKKVVFPQKGDVLIVRSGVNAGDVAVIENDIDHAIIGADNLLLKPDLKKVIPKFIQVYFFTTSGRKILNRYLTGATNKHISPYFLAKVDFPLINKKSQLKCIDIFVTGLRSKQQKDAQAKKLLESIDEYLLNELGIEHIEIFASKYGMHSLPTRNECVKTQRFDIKLSEIGSRYDPYYHLPIYKSIVESIEKGRYDSHKLLSVCEQIKSGSAPKVFYENGNHYLKVRNVKDLDFDWETDKISNEDLSANHLVAKGDIIIVTMGAGSLGKLSVFEDDYICQYDPKLTKLTVKPNINNYYLAYFMRSQIFQKLLEKIVRGSTGMTMINPTDLGKLIVPIPPIEKQNEIAEHIGQLREQVKQLHEEAIEILEKAKQEVEQIILG